MAAFQSFRSALHGFNREDVVRYIEYLNNVHNAKTGQLRNEIQALRRELDTLRSQEPVQDLSADLAAANSRIAELEAALEGMQNSSAATENELEAYRRAERVERVAQERVDALYEQYNGIVADATARTDASAADIATLADSISAQLAQLQAALEQSKNTMKDTAATLYAIRPLQE